MGFLRPDNPVQEAPVLGPVGGPRPMPNVIPSIDPDQAWAEGLPQQSGNFLQMLGAAPIASVSPNLSADITAASPQSVPAVSRTPRQRRSALDIIGGIADTVASVGGAAPLYRQNLDAAAERQRQIDMDAMQREQFGLQQQLGGQQLQTGEQAIAANERAAEADVRTRAAQALTGVFDAEDPVAAWDTVSATAGLPEEARNQIRNILASGQNPQNIARALGYEEPRQGSLPSAVQNYAAYRQILATEGPEAAEQFLALAQPSSQLTPYQAALLQQREREFQWKTSPNNPDNAPGGNLTPGQEALDKAFATDFAAYSAAGGFADVQKGINQLREARTLLGEGGVTGGPTGWLPTWVRSAVNEKSVSVQEAVEEVVQRNLRAVLGAQFTQKEGERLIERAFNPRLSEEENIRRLDRLIGQIETAAQAREAAGQYFNRYGTLQGWNGPTFTVSDFESAIEGNAPTPARGGRRIVPRGQAGQAPSAAIAEARRRGLIQ